MEPDYVTAIANALNSKSTPPDVGDDYSDAKKWVIESLQGFGAGAAYPLTYLPDAAGAVTGRDWSGANWRQTLNQLRAAAPIAYRAGSIAMPGLGALRLGGATATETARFLPALIGLGSGVGQVESFGRDIMDEYHGRNRLRKPLPNSYGYL